MKKLTYILFIVILFTLGCNSFKNPELEISFDLNKTENFVPSTQIAIWLEKPDGEYVKTLFVCDYLAYGGFNIKEICPSWMNKAKWDKVPREEVDAVSQATPDVGNTVLIIDCPKDKVPNGLYKYFIEIHIIDNFNELYSGNIEIKKRGNEIISNAVRFYQPKKYPAANNLLSNITLNYKN